MPLTLLRYSFALMMVAGVAFAQSVPLPSVNLSSTITTTNTFQTVQGQTNNRNGCAIQNNGDNDMWVYPGPKAKATKAASIILAPGQPMSCAIGGSTVIKDEINITGTSGDAFFANFQ